MDHLNINIPVHMQTRNWTDLYNCLRNIHLCFLTAYWTVRWNKLNNEHTKENAKYTQQEKIHSAGTETEVAACLLTVTRLCPVHSLRSPGQYLEVFTNSYYVSLLLVTYKKNLNVPLSFKCFNVFGW
jgi:hypothetical protein